jgi:hypothetical protein
VLQGRRQDDRQTVQQVTQHRTLLADGEEDLAEPAVGVEPDLDVDALAVHLDLAAL